MLNIGRARLYTCENVAVFSLRGFLAVNTETLGFFFWGGGWFREDRKTKWSVKWQLLRPAETLQCASFEHFMHSLME